LKGQPAVYLGIEAPFTILVLHPTFAWRLMEGQTVHADRHFDVDFQHAGIRRNRR
jgi:hypothetical protein